MRHRDAAERAQLIWIAVLLTPSVMTIGSFTWFFLVSRKLLPAWTLLPGVLLLLPLFTWRLILLVEAATERASFRFITTLKAGDADPQRTGFSRQEALAAQGRLGEAADAYREHLLATPGDVAAHVALARLLAGPLADRDGAEAEWLAARRLAPGPDWARIITNDLIDFYQRTGQEGRLRVELARFADLQRGTKASDAAVRRLRELKERADYDD